MKTLELWQVDINNKYWLDDDLNIWEYEEDFYEYHFDECTCIKDNYEVWQEEVAEEHNLQELKGDEIIKIIYEDMLETIEMYRNRKW